MFALVSLGLVVRESMSSHGLALCPLGLLFALVSVGLLVWEYLGSRGWVVRHVGLVVCPGVFGYDGLGVFGFM